jgi:hypothetical protein
MEKEQVMLNNRSRRRLAALGSVLILSGVGTTAAAVAATFGSTLSGDNVVGGGDSDGWGRARVRVDDTLNTICVDLEVRSIGQVTGARVHRGNNGVNGPPVVNLDRPDGEDQDEDDCDTIGDALADQIQANPASFYVTIATTDHPDGALRGQLAPTGD